MPLNVKDGCMKATASKIFDTKEKMMTFGVKLPGKKNQDGTWKNTKCYGTLVGDAFANRQGFTEGTDFTSNSYSVDAFVNKSGEPCLNVTFFEIEFTKSESADNDFDPSLLPF